MPVRTSGLALVVTAIAVFSLLSTARPALAAGPTFTVDSLLDQPDDLTAPGTCHTAANTCTLRAAIMQANRTTGVGATVVLPASAEPYLLTIPTSVSDSEFDGDLNLTAPVTGNPVISIVGAGAATTIIDANQLDRVLSIEAGRTATISGVTLRHGYRASGDGGGINNDGSLTLDHVTISDNHAVYGGGIWDSHVLTVVDSTIGQNTTTGGGAGIGSTGDLNVRNSTIEGNSADGFGGGIYTALGLTMRNSTISGNHADLGGGIINYQDMTAMNSTISHNDADSDGGGVFNNHGTANVYNVTIAFNGADADGDSTGVAGGVFNYDANNAFFNLRNTLVVGNVTSDSTLFGYYDDCGGSLTGYGANLFKAVLVASDCTVGGSWGPLSNLSTLGPLQDNGGPTETIALLEGSIAIDGTNPSFPCVDYASVPLDTDQRGEPRVSGARCDIGAFEVPEPGALAAVATAITMLVSMQTARRNRRRIAGFAIAASVLVSAAAPAVADATFTVDSISDEPDDLTLPGTCHTAANTCTLRAATMQANRSDVGATIILPAGLYTLTIPAVFPDGQTNGDLNLTSPESGDPVITIVGAGAASTIIDANHIDRVLSVSQERIASISGVTIRNGNAQFDGGGIDNDGTLTLTNATVSDSHADFSGGGIYNSHILDVIDSRISHNVSAEVGVGGGIYSSGDLTVRNSTIFANLAGQHGGGIYSSQTLTVRNSTISDNQAALDGGGIYNVDENMIDDVDASLIVVNSTISQNDAIRSGGGIYNNTATTNVYNTTIAFNHADAVGGTPSGVGGGVFNTATFNLRNSLLALNFQGSITFGTFDDCAGTLTGYGENLFQAALVSSGCALAGSWDFLSDPGTLGPLQDNGGPTWTQALLPGSNAIDGSVGGCVDESSVPIPTDQRGAPRVSGASCDIGAFEVPEPGSLAAVATAMAMLVSIRRGGRADHE